MDMQVLESSLARRHIYITTSAISTNTISTNTNYTNNTNSGGGRIGIGFGIGEGLLRWKTQYFKIVSQVMETSTTNGSDNTVGTYVSS